MFVYRCGIGERLQKALKHLFGGPLLLPWRVHCCLRGAEVRKAGALPGNAATQVDAHSDTALGPADFGWERGLHAQLMSQLVLAGMRRRSRVSLRSATPRSAATLHSNCHLAVPSLLCSLAGGLQLRFRCSHACVF